MDKNNIIILALVIIIIALLVGVVSVMFNVTKEDSILVFKSESVLTEGDSINVKLTDANGNAIANQTVNVTITDKDNTNSYYSVVTDDKGVGTLKLDKNVGNYVVAISYGGNDKYSSSNSNQTLTIKEKEVVEAEHISSDASSSDDDPGAFYSPQAGRTIHTGDIEISPGGERMRHLGNNKWEKVD